MVKQMYLRLTSLNLGLWLLSGVMLALALGSFSRGSSESAGLNQMPLFVWLEHAPISFSWWLWIAAALVALLCLNALLCSIEALRKKGRSIAPHLMHAGFLLIVVAHLCSAYGSYKQQLPMAQGDYVGFRDGEQARVERISGEAGPMGMLTSYRAEIRFQDGSLARVAPNRPLFHKGYGIYLKEVELEPVPVGVFEIHREPGALPALLGAVIFAAGNVLLLARRRER
jgi:hypothetical protein